MFRRHATNDSSFAVPGGSGGLVRAHSVAPAPDRDVIDGEIPLRHHLFEISETEPKPKIPADTQNDDLGFKMPPFE